MCSLSIQFFFRASFGLNQDKCEGVNPLWTFLGSSWSLLSTDGWAPQQLLQGIMLFNITRCLWSSLISDWIHTRICFLFQTFSIFHIKDLINCFSNGLLLVRIVQHLSSFWCCQEERKWLRSEMCDKMYLENTSNSFIPRHFYFSNLFWRKRLLIRI